MRIIEQIPEMQRWSEAERCAGRRIVFVPTMGFLHDGHLSLVREGRRVGDRVVVFALQGRFVSPIVGFHQGLFRVVEEGDVPVVLNAGRFPVTVEGKAHRFGSAVEGTKSAMPLDAFLDHVRETLGARPDATR